MNEQIAFLSLARRVGNPIASRPETIAAVEAFELVRAFRALPPSQQRVVHAMLRCLAWFQRSKIDRVPAN